MSKIRTALALSLAVISLPVLADGTGGYTARINITDGDTVVTSGSTYTGKGDPVRMGVSSSRQYGGSDGPYVETGFRFEMLPRQQGEAMHVEINLIRTEVTDATTGAVREEAAVIQGDATRDGDGWTYQTDKLPGGKVMRVTFRDSPRPE